ncbi:hypothetical protein ACXWRW_12115, partial [Streptococcus pyogenes]
FSLTRGALLLPPPFSLPSFSLLFPSFPFFSSPPFPPSPPFPSLPSLFFSPFAPPSPPLSPFSLPVSSFPPFFFSFS